MKDGEKEISADLDNLKLFLKLHIFMLLFHFFTEGLPKYDIDDADLPNQYDDDVENSPRLSFKCYLNNSILCLDDLKDTIACRLDLYLIYDRPKMKALKEKLLGQPFSVENPSQNACICQELRFNIVKCNPYFCKFDDLDGTKSFKKINKREIIKPFAMCYTSKNTLERFATESFRVNTSTDINVEKVSVKISINQIASFMSMISNTFRILGEKYVNKIKRDEEMNENIHNPMNSVTKKSVFDNYDPSGADAKNFKETIEVFSSRYYQVPKKRVAGTYDIDDDIDEQSALTSKAQNIGKLKSSPIKIGKKEMDKENREERKGSIPEDEIESKGTNLFTFFFHGLSIYFINDYRDNFYPVLCLSLKETNYMRENRIEDSFVSQAQLEAAFDYYNIKNGYWEPFIEGLDIEFQFDKQAESQFIQIKGKESINLNISPDFVSVLNYCLKSWNQAQRNLELKAKNEEFKQGEVTEMFSEEVKQSPDDDIKTEERHTLFTLYEDEEVVDIATPYKVRNLTGMTIFVETLFEGKKEKYILNDSQTTKIAVSYEKQTHKNFEGIASKMNDNVKIQFQGLYLPIHKISLNHLGQNTHKLTESDEEQDYIFYETKVIDMNKVLTLRTRNLLINSTQFVYDVIIKNPDKRDKDKKYRLKPGETISFPREMIDCKISLKTVDDEHFSNYIPAKKLIFRTAVDHTNYIRSGKTFTMVRKEQNKTLNNCFDVHLIPPIRIRNGLPVIINISLLGQDIEFLQDKAEEKHISFYSPEEVIQLSVKLDGYEKEPVAIKFLKKSYEKHIKLQSMDNKYSTLNLYANFSDEKAGCFITFYCKTCFINACSMPLNIYNTTTNTRGIYIPNVTSWKNLVIASDITHCYFMLDKDSKSEEICVEGGSLTGQVSVMKASTKEMAELVYTTTLSLIDVNQSIYTKVITIMPKYVIVNKTDQKLLLTQEGLEDDFTIIDSYARENFRWLDGKGIKRTMIKILDSTADDPINEWMWSSSFNLEEIGAHSIRNVNSKDPSKFYYWKVDRRIQNDIIFITINKEDEKHPLYLIENKAKNIILKYRQEGGKIWEYCDTHQSNRFAWDNLYKKHMIQCEAWVKGKKNRWLCNINIMLDVMEQSDKMRYNLKDIMDHHELQENGYSDKKRVLNYRTHTNGYTKILTFDDKTMIVEEKEAEDHAPELMVNVELGGLGISLVCDANPDHVNERREIVFCSLRDIQGICIDFKTERKLQLRIGRMQVDNQFALDTPFPVTLFNSNVKIEDNKEKSKPFFNLNVIVAKDVPDVLYFKRIEFLIQKIILQCDDELVLNLVYFCTIVMKILNTTFTGVSEIFVRSSEKTDQFNHAVMTNSDQEISKRLIAKVPDWKTEEIAMSKYQIYIKNYSSSPLFLKISFYTSMRIETDPGFNSFLKRFGLALNTIEDAPIKINALELRDVVGTLNDIGYILKDRYMIRLKRNLFSILGASSLIGNPIQLVNNVSSGVKDFFYKPIEGLVEGPIEGGKGLVKGTGSLFKHTVQGTFSSTSSIFSSLSKGVLVLANDKDYMKEREANNYREKPENVFEGLGFGIKSAAKSFGSGVTGLVRMPVSGAKKKGFSGFLSGTVKGVTGLVAKPVSGAMDFLSKTSEGIKNTTMMFEDAKGLGMERIRLPRVFYSRQRVFKVFNELHSFSYAYLIKHKKLNSNDPFVDALIIAKDPVQIFVLCETKILKIHIVKDRVTLSIPTKCIKKIEKADKMIILWIIDSNFRNSKVKVDIESDAIKERVYNLFQEMYK